METKKKSACPCRKLHMHSIIMFASSSTSLLSLHKAILVSNKLNRNKKEICPPSAKLKCILLFASSSSSSSSLLSLSLAFTPHPTPLLLSIYTKLLSRSGGGFYFDESVHCLILSVTGCFFLSSFFCSLLFKIHVYSFHDNPPSLPPSLPPFLFLVCRSEQSLQCLRRGHGLGVRHLFIAEVGMHEEEK